MFPVSPGCRMKKSYHHPVCNLVIQYSARSSEGSHKLIGNLIHRWMASMSRRFKIFWEFWMWMLFHVEDYLILPISCGIGRMERWIKQVLTVHRIILHIRNGRMLQSGLATDRIRGSTAAVLFVEFSRKRFQEAQSAKLN